jgi:hypothetical protein
MLAALRTPAASYITMRAKMRLRAKAVEEKPSQSPVEVARAETKAE